MLLCQDLPEAAPAPWEALPDRSPLAGLGRTLAQLDQSVQLLAVQLRLDTLEGFGVDG